MRLVELAQQKSRMQLVKPKSFENLSHGVGSGWEWVELLHIYWIKVMLLGLVVETCLAVFFSCGVVFLPLSVQDGMIFLYHSCKERPLEDRYWLALCAAGRPENQGGLSTAHLHQR